MSRPSSPRVVRSGIGCGYVLTVGIMVVALLLINGLFTRAFVLSNMVEADLRVTQTVQFVVPLLLIVVEFWVYDRLVQAGRT